MGTIAPSYRARSFLHGSRDRSRGSAVFAAKEATSALPIVLTFGDGDPVQHGLIESLNKPKR
jgi:hypothetical protein